MDCPWDKVKMAVVKVQLYQASPLEETMGWPDSSWGNMHVHNANLCVRDIAFPGPQENVQNQALTSLRAELYKKHRELDGFCLYLWVESIVWCNCSVDLELEQPWESCQAEHHN